MEKEILLLVRNETGNVVDWDYDGYEEIDIIPEREDPFDFNY